MSDLNAELLNKIDQAVDSLVSILKKQIVSGTGFQKRGLWDRFKNWVSNTWHGRYSQKNPYYFINTLGDFAGSSSNKNKPKSESNNYQRLTLQQYSEIKHLFDKLENDINTINEAESGVENLRIMKLIDDWANTLKITLKKVFSDSIKKSTPAEPSAKPLIKSLDQCSIDLENKHKEGKISPKDYFVIKAMIDRGDIRDACKALEAILNKIKEQPEVEEPKAKEPETKVEEPETKVEEPESKEEPKVEEPKTKEEENFPHNLDNTRVSFKKIRDALRNKMPYKKYFKEWESKASPYQKTKLDKLEKSLQKGLVGEVDEEDFVSSMKRYKIIVGHIVDNSEPPAETKMEHFSILSPLNLDQKKNYIKNLIKKR